jgi:serpin B
MPNEPKNTETFFDNFNSEQISLILKTAESEKIQLSVPKFTGKCDFELSESLKKGGMIRSFSDTADFSSMSDVPHLHVSKAYHSAFIEVNETGTEASAATALVMERSLSANLKHITINHPFLYFILDIKTEQILFMGACFEPIFEEKK